MSEEQHHQLALPQGTRIRDFEFHRVLGYGGFGITYLGWNIALDIPVAIKEYLPTDLATRRSDQSVVPQSSQAASDFQWGLERFLDEARTLARLQHPNIVRVHHFFEAHSTAYIAMDYVEGEDLSAYLTRKETLGEDELKGILYPLLDALEVIHQADFLHRDIKPGNIVLRDSDGSPVLLDFGAARQAIGAKSRSVTSIVTPGYAPIEQYSSRGRQGAWTDLYALGGVCYRALTGQVPDDATDRMRQDPLVSVAERCAGQASSAFLSAIDVALSVDEADRPQSVGAWRGALEAEAAEAQELGDDSVETEKDEVDDATIARRVEQDAPPSERQKRFPYKRLAAVLGIVALLVVGGKMYVDHAEKQRQEQVFVAEVGRLPHPREMNKGKTDLHIAAELNLPVITISLMNQGADVHAKDESEDGGGTPLHWAASGNAPETVLMALWLLAHGAAVDAKDNNGATPLHEAASATAAAAAEVLRQRGAAVDAKDNNGRTPLHEAASATATATAEVLLQQGAAVDAKNNDGNTPLYVAAFQNATETAEVLRRYGGRE
jgi:serine/threonine protein kinase